MILIMFSCKKEKETGCATPADSRLVGVWLKDSSIEYGIKYRTPYVPGVSVQSGMEIKQTVWQNKQRQTNGSIINQGAGFPIQLKCDGIWFDESPNKAAYTYVVSSDSTIELTSTTNGILTYYSRVK